eukprot:6172774-Pleurochrysis_carterae.AAC.2
MNITAKMAATDAKKVRCGRALAGSPCRRVCSSTSAQSTSPSTHPRATPSTQSSSNGLTRSPTARRRSP